jgi:hypothetical protein
MNNHTKTLSEVFIVYNNRDDDDYGNHNNSDNTNSNNNRGTNNNNIKETMITIILTVIGQYWVVSILSRNS